MVDHGVGAVNVDLRLSDALDQILNGFLGGHQLQLSLKAVDLDLRLVDALGQILHGFLGGYQLDIRFESVDVHLRAGEAGAHVGDGCLVGFEGDGGVEAVNEDLRAVQAVAELIQLTGPKVDLLVCAVHLDLRLRDAGAQGVHGGAVRLELDGCLRAVDADLCLGEAVLRLRQLRLGGFKVDLTFHAVQLDHRAGDDGAQLGDLFLSRFEVDQLRIGADLLSVHFDDAGVHLDHLGIELDERLVLVKTVFEDLQPLEGVGGVGHQGGHLGLYGCFLVADGQLGEPVMEVVALDAHDAGLLHGGVDQADGHQVAQADDLILVPRHLLQVLDGGRHGAGWLFDRLQVLPAFGDQVLIILRVIDLHHSGVHTILCNGLGILNPGLALGLVHRVAGGDVPRDLPDAVVLRLILGTGGLAQHIQPCDGRVGLDVVDVGRVLLAAKDPAAEFRLVLLQLDDAAADLPAGKGIIRDDLPLV